jgi:hypothetical protein
MYISFALLYVIRRVQSNQEGLNFDDTHRRLVYTADLNLLGESVRTVKEKQKLFWYQCLYRY